ncbi:MAG: hypothetical protein RIQ78_1500 [Bacteroidota bacterium]|jgi:hypothetical protein
MKIKSLSPLLALLFTVSVAQAQMELVHETERTMSFGIRPCFRLEFGKIEVDIIENVWKDFAKENFDAKLKKSKGEWTATSLNTAFMGEEPYAIYSTIEKNGDKTALTVWVDAGSYFLNRRDNRVSTQEMTRKLKQCYFDIRRAAIGKELKVAEDELKDLENRQKKLVRENDGLVKDIESWKSKIQRAEQDIVNNQQAQESNMGDQEVQRRKVEEVRRKLENVENEGRQ